MPKGTVDYLILLAGTNPLPNYISTLAFVKESTVVYLVSTESSTVDEGHKTIGTNKVALNIENKIMETLKIKVIRKTCNKSSIKEINKMADEIIKEIEAENPEKDHENKKVIGLDYTGGTKVMAAVFYNQFKVFETENKNYGNYNVYYSYVDSEVGKILVENNDNKELKDILKENQIKIEDICNLHGYYDISYSSIESNKEMEWIKDIKLTNSHSVDFDAIYLKGFQMYFVKEEAYEKKADLKLRLFRAKDMAEKLGGSQFKLCFICKFKEIKMLKDEVEMFYNKNGRKFIKIIDRSNNNVEEEIQSFMEEM